MSCTENESGPFVVFFLPAVVGCLTILLARRWANSQVPNTSSTAISRRRKIIKDPLVKRTLPPIACKMIPPGSKKTASVNKKLPEEESNGKRLGRSSKLPTNTTNGVSVNENKLSDEPVAPKHMLYPYVPHDGTLLFEVMTFVFTLVATGLQFLNLYRTAWWLPNSYTNQAMNFYLIDPNLVAFIVTILFRRLLLKLTLVTMTSFFTSKILPHAASAARMFCLGVLIGSLAWCTYFIALKHPLIKIFYLCYPAVVYFLLFGFQSGPFLELDNSETPSLHCCTHDPGQVRAEVDGMREDFNLRLKKILFNSVIGAYYSSLMPCCFAQSYLYYDVFAAAQQAVFVWGGLFGRYGAQLASGGHCDVPHRAALHLGRWRQLAGTEAPGDSPVWSGEKLWSQGARVTNSSRSITYEAITPTVAAQPGNSKHTRFYMVFINPSLMLCVMLCLQLSLVIVQLCVLFSSMLWHNFLSVLILLFMNYYTLFKLMRDYMIAWKVHKVENMIQEKKLSSDAIPL